MNRTHPLFGGLRLWKQPKVPLVLQTETAECGLACLAMIAQYHGAQEPLPLLRKRFPFSTRGATLTDLMHVAERLGLQTRPVRAEMGGLKLLRLPCILHWDFTHFVVLTEVGQRHIVVHDPSGGKQRLTLQEASRRFTGVALELWPSNEFKVESRPKGTSVRRLLGHQKGLFAALSSIFAIALSLEVLVLSGPFYLQWVVDKVIPSRDRDLMTLLVIGFLILTLLQQGLTAGRAWQIFRVGTVVGVQVRANLFRDLLNLPLAYFENRQVADIISRFSSIEQIQRIVTTSYLEALIDGLMTTATVALMLTYSPSLALVSIFAVLLYVLGRLAYFGSHKAAIESQIVNAAKQQSHFLESVRGIKAVKLLQSNEQRRRSWISLLVDQTNAEIKQQKLSILHRLLNGCLLGAAAIITVWLGADRVLSGGFSTGALVAFVSYRTLFESRVTALVDKLFEFRTVRILMERLEDILLSEPERRESGNVETTFSEPLSIEFKGVSFSYGEGQPDVLSGLSLKIEPGESVAVVGPSGSGKTTLVNLLLGVLTPSGGDILVNGRPLIRHDLNSLRGAIGAVLQDDILFSGTIAENISFFDRDADADWVADCARAACIATEIEQMPMGYSAPLGEYGFSVSGGQKQRILLARALYKRPKLLIFDEATSHLDVETERRVNEEIRKMDVTRIVIAHRPETIKSAGRVIDLFSSQTK